MPTAYFCFMTDVLLTQWANGTGEVQFMLGLLLFIISNWLGNRSVSVGYVTISMFTQNESAPAAPAFNYVIRVFTPVVYLIICSALLYQLNLDVFIANFFMVSVYYVIIRFSINIIQGRAKLINWTRQFVYYASIVGLSWGAYTKFIATRSSVFPDFSSIANEVWVIIALFLYKIVNDLTISQSSAERRKKNYLEEKFEEIRNEYGSIVDRELDNDVLKATTYAIIIYENFNRSAAVRWVENVSFKLTGRPHTLGIMQVRSDEFINDKQSVALGTKKIRSSYEAYSSAFNPEVDEFHYESMGYGPVIAAYNGGISYREEVETLTRIILDKYYSETSDTLNPSPQKENVTSEANTVIVLSAGE